MCVCVWFILFIFSFVVDQVDGSGIHKKIICFKKKKIFSLFQRINFSKTKLKTLCKKKKNKEDKPHTKAHKLYI